MRGFWIAQMYTVLIATSYALWHRDTAAMGFLVAVCEYSYFLSLQIRSRAY